MERQKPKAARKPRIDPTREYRQPRGRYEDAEPAVELHQKCGGGRRILRKHIGSH